MLLARFLWVGVWVWLLAAPAAVLHPGEPVDLGSGAVAVWAGQGWHQLMAP